MTLLKIIKDPYARLIFNFVYALGNFALGCWSHSWWFITVSIYYAVLAITRFSVLQVQKLSMTGSDTARCAERTAGVLLVVLSFCLVGINILSAVKERGRAHHEIIMIAIATYTFTRIVVAIISLVRAKRDPAPTVRALRNISFADACVSLYALQRSMLVSFPGMDEIRLCNILTGTGVWIVVLLLGINLIGGRCVTVAKSKLAKANEKIADTITVGYKKVENGVVEGYKKVERGVTGVYTKIEDKFVERYLTKDGESVEQAKARLKNRETDK